jgi:hypothetical protein
MALYQAVGLQQLLRGLRPLGLADARLALTDSDSLSGRHSNLIGRRPATTGHWRT